MKQRTELARRAATEALRVRRSQGLQLWQAICVYDLAEEKLGLRVYFDAVPSMEGMYMNSLPPTIILSSLRPAGRVAYTCAHEIGHHVFAHGARVDQELEDNSLQQLGAEEYLAECFAGFLLMPRLCVSHGFAKRGWGISECIPEQVFVVAGWLGVGYTALLNHMCHSLKLISLAKTKELCKVPVKRIKRQLVGKELQENVFWADRHWVGRPIDIQAGDVIVAGERSGFEGDVAKPTSLAPVKQAFVGVRPGIGRLYADDGSWAAFVRVSRREYKGWGRYRHLEDPEHE